MLVADGTATFIRERDCNSGIGLRPSHVIASRFAAAVHALGFYSVASVKLLHVIQFPAKAAFRHEHFHYVGISSLGGFRSRGTVGLHGSSSRVRNALRATGPISSCDLEIEIWQFLPVEIQVDLTDRHGSD